MSRLKALCLIISLIMNVQIFAMDDAVADKYVQDQVSTCNKNTAMEWNPSLNRCVGKVEARAQRNEAKACNELEDIEQKKACHLQLAEKNTGLNGDPNSLNQGNLGKSAIMNGVGTAYAILGFINGLGSSKTESNCTSKKIFGYTAMAGTVTDIWLKIRSKKKMNSLIDKYQLDKTQSPYEAQIRALYYLKEEQETVANIAAAEKKRNMLLMLGYGAATAYALYEMATPNLNSQCYVKEPEKASSAPCPKPAGDESCLTVAATETGNKPNSAAGDERMREANTGELQGEAPAGAPPPPAAAPAAVATNESNGLYHDELAGASDPQPPGTTITSKTNGNITNLEIINDPNNGNRTSVIVDDQVLYGKKVIGVLDKKSKPPTITYFGNATTVPVTSAEFPGKKSTVLMQGIGGGDGKSMTDVGLNFNKGKSNPFSSASKIDFVTPGAGKVNVTSPTGTTSLKTLTPTNLKVPKKGGGS